MVTCMGYYLIVVLRVVEASADNDVDSAALAQLWVVIPQALIENFVRFLIVEIIPWHRGRTRASVMFSCTCNPSVIAKRQRRPIAVARHFRVCRTAAHDEATCLLHPFRKLPGTESNGHVRYFLLAVEIVLFLCRAVFVTRTVLLLLDQQASASLVQEALLEDVVDLDHKQPSAYLANDFYLFAILIVHRDGSLRHRLGKTELRL